MADKNLVVSDDKLPAALQADFEQDQGQGYEEASSDSYAIPFLAIMQSNSPQVKKSSGSYIKGAAEGMVFNTVTNELFDTEKNPLQVVLCHHRVADVEWILKTEGGGYVEEHPVGQAPKTVRSDQNRDVVEDNPTHEILRTYYYYVLVIKPDGTPEPALIGMTRTQAKKGKRWYSVLNNVKLKKKSGEGVYSPPTFAHVSALTTTPESKDDYSWYTWQAERVGLLSDAGIYNAAKEFHEAVRSGQLREATETQQAAEADDGASQNASAEANAEAEY